MGTVRLKNHTGRISVIGSVVKLDPADPKSFVLASVGDAGVVGTVTQSVPNNYSCVINLINTVDWATLDIGANYFTSDGIVVDGYTVAPPTGSNVSLWYNSLGGNEGLLISYNWDTTTVNDLLLDGDEIVFGFIGNMSGKGTSIFIGKAEFHNDVLIDERTLTLTGGLKETVINVSDPTYTVQDTDILICADTTLTNISVYLPAAIGEGRALQIANVGTGTVTVVTDGDPSDPSSLDTIDDVTTKSLAQWQTLDIRDYDVNKWKIISLYTP
jgi:hypothetical protein